MSKYTVYLTTTASFSVTVDAEDYDEAIERAVDKAPSPETFVDISHQRQFGLGLGDAWEPESVIDETTEKTVWTVKKIRWNDRGEK